MKPYFIGLTAILLTVFACKDDEIDPIVEKPLLLSYESVSGDTKLKAEYEYDSKGRIKKVSWERTTPGTTQGVDVFVYDDAGKLKEQIRSITGLVDEKTTYTWNDRYIFASTIYENNKKTGFSFYDYNEKGQLEIVEIYRGKANSGFLRTDSIGFTYHADGNLFQMIKYAGDNYGFMTLLSTQTFPEYFSTPNPVATVEILPVVSLQQTVPKEYTVADMNNNNFSYSMQYALRPDGYPRERTITSAGAEERTIYTYDR